MVTNFYSSLNVFSISSWKLFEFIFGDVISMFTTKVDKLTKASSKFMNSLRLSEFPNFPKTNEKSGKLFIMHFIHFSGGTTCRWCLWSIILYFLCLLILCLLWKMKYWEYAAFSDKIGKAENTINLPEYWQKTFSVLFYRLRLGCFLFGNFNNSWAFIVERWRGEHVQISCVLNLEDK